MSGHKRKTLNAPTGGNYRKMNGTSYKKKAWSMDCLIPILCMAGFTILLLSTAFQ